jgi:hypothetical protein
MQSRASLAEGLRNSGWNALPSSPGWSRHSRGLSLEPRPAARRSASRLPIPSAQSTQWNESALGFYASPWLRSRPRYKSNWLMRMLDGITRTLWPLAAMDDLSNWLQDGSAEARAFLGIGAGVAAALLIFQTFVPLLWVQSLVNSSIFFGQGAFVLILASLVAGATVLPMVIAQVIPVLTRLLIFAGLCALAAGVFYEGYQLLVSAKLL